MTDREKLMALFDEFGIGYEVSADPPDIYCHEGNPKITGYSCFYAVFRFTEAGAFKEMGVYE